MHPVHFPSTGRTITLDEIRRTQRSANARLSRIAAQLEIEEWRYTGPANADTGDAATSRPADLEVSGPDGHLPLQGTRIRYLWDTGHQRLAMHMQPLGHSVTGSQPAGEVNEPAHVQMVQRLSADDELSALMQDNTVVLERYGKNHPLGARAMNDWPLKHGLENDFFFEMAEHWGGKLEAVQEDGLDLVKVTWSAMGVDTIEWFRPDQGLRLHRKETRDLQKRLHARIVADDYRSINGFPYPFTYEVTMWDDWDARNVTQMHRCRVHAADFAAQPTDEDFMLDIPAGATLTRVVDAQSILGVNRARVSDRIPRPMRTDVVTLFGKMAGTESRPAEAADARTR